MKNNRVLFGLLAAVFLLAKRLTALCILDLNELRIFGLALHQPYPCQMLNRFNRNFGGETLGNF
jgi:hypothetical protein